MSCDYSLMWISNDRVMNPKGLIGMSEEKAIGSLIWTRKIMGSDYRAFIYDPAVSSIFDHNGRYNWKLIKALEKKSKKLIRVEK